MQVDNTLSRAAEESEAEDATRSQAALYLVLQSDRPQTAPTRYSLAGFDGVLIGRGSELAAATVTLDGVRTLSLQIPDGWLSRVHARLARVVRQWFVDDAGSRNGTFLDGDPVKKATYVPDGGLVELGHT